MTALNYRHLHYFRAVAHEGNLTRAAGRLNLSQSALSVQIRQLEQRLGHDLFERRGRGLHLTEAGRIALDHADAIFATGDELVGTLSQTGRARQAVRIGALSTLSRNYQLGFARPLLGRREAEIVLRSGGAADLFEGLRALALDVVLTNAVPPQDSLTPFVTQRLAAQAVGLFGTPGRVAGRAPAALLAAEPVILPHGGPVRAGFDALAARLGVRPLIAAEVDDMAMIRLLAREDAGLAVVPAVVVRDELDEGRLVEASAPLGLTETFHAVTIARRFPNPWVSVLIDAARQDGPD